MTPLLTIITPIHRMEGKLDNLCVWLSETNEISVEIILIDDLHSKITTDEINKIIHNFPLAPIKIIRGKFNSPGESRNAALVTALGKWVMFWDSDDVGFPKRVIEALKEIEVQTDVVIFSFEICSWNDHSNTSRYSVSELWSSLLEITAKPGIWRMAIRREFLNDVRFPHVLMAEDQIFLSRLNLKSPTFQYINIVAYRYFKNVPDQLTSDRNSLLNLREALVISRRELSTVPNNLVNADLYLRQCLAALKFGNLSLKIHSLVRLFEFLLSTQVINRMKLLFRVVNV